MSRKLAIAVNWQGNLDVKRMVARAEIADRAGMEVAFLVLAGIGLLGSVMVWLVMPETRPSKIELSQSVRE